MSNIQNPSPNILDSFREDPVFLSLPSEDIGATLRLIKCFSNKPEDSEFDFRRTLTDPGYYAIMKSYYCRAIKWGIPVPPELSAYLQDQNIIDAYALMSKPPHPVSDTTKETILAEATRA
jgi:hypothetical protein